MSFTLPDFISMCPFPLTKNPHYAQASTRSLEWVMSLDILDDRNRAAFNKADFGLLAAYTYPSANEDQLKTCCDFLCILFALDDISDEQNPEDASHMMVHVAARAMKDPQFDDGSTLSAMIKQFTSRLRADMPPAGYRRFVEQFEEYCIAVGKEADFRDQQRVLGLDAYIALRRENGAVQPCLRLFSYVLQVDLPEEIINHPLIVSMYTAAADMILWSNDLVSYPREAAIGHDANFVPVAMKEMNISLQGAADHVGMLFKDLMDDFLKCKANLPSFGPEWDDVVPKLIALLEAWIIGNILWSFETPRYFGADAAEVKETRVVKCRPSKMSDL